MLLGLKPDSVRRVTVDVGGRRHAALVREHAWQLVLAADEFEVAIEEAIVRFA